MAGLIRNECDHEADVEARLALALKELADIRMALEESAILAITDAQGRITHANEKFCTLSGYTREELIGQTHRIVNSGYHPVEFFRDMWNTITTGRIWRGEVCNRAKNGTLYWMDATIVPVKDEDGIPCRYIAVRRDITAFKAQAEELTTAREKALQAVRIKSDFLANMSHEIRTPMNGVLGMIQLLRETHLDDYQREAADLLHASAESLMEIINDILDFSKLEAGKLLIHPTVIDLPVSMMQMAALMRPLAQKKGLEFLIRMSPSLPHLIIVDEGRLRQILQNFLVNAFKFTERGQVLLNVDCLPSDTVGEALLQFSVSDTGIGISERMLERIFEKFIQADSSAKRSHGGTGLGLAICMQLAHMMGGTVGVGSRLGEGSTFWLTLPVPLGEAMPVDEIVAEASSLKGLRLLMIGPSATQSRIVAEHLDSWEIVHHTVSTAAEALEALRYARRAGLSYELCLVDSELNDMMPEKLAGEIRQDPTLRALRLILMTQAIGGCQTRRCKQAGFNGCLGKPLAPDAMIKVLLACLSNGETGFHCSFEDKRENAMDDTTDSASGSLRKSQPRAARILLAEDNVINQRVISMLLKKMGYSVDVAADGRQVLSCLGHAQYDLILMDCQMPLMDGFETTAAIRELGGRLATIPIIAVTANALAGEADKCLAAGMDDYLPKPVRMEDLKAMLPRWLEHASTEASSDEAQPGILESLPMIDLPALREDADNDEAFLHQTAGLFIQRAQQVMQGLREGLERQDFASIAALSHEMKGMCLTFHVHSPLPENLLRLEDAAREHDVTACRQMVAEQLPLLEKLNAAIEQLLDSLNTSQPME